MIKRGDFCQVHHTARGTGARVRCAEDEPLYPGVQHCPDAHCTGFESNVERGFGQPVVTGPGTCSPDCPDLGMRGGVARCDRPVVRSCQHVPALIHQDRSNGYFGFSERCFGLLDCKAHKVMIAFQESFSAHRTSLPIANSTILVYRKVLLQVLVGERAVLTIQGAITDCDLTGGILPPESARAQRGKLFMECKDTKRESLPPEAAPCVCQPPGLPKKHACPDCHFCQLCSDARCHCCRGEKKAARCPKMSFSEQIRLYNELNAKDPVLRKR